MDTPSRLPHISNTVQQAFGSWLQHKLLLTRVAAKRKRISTRYGKDDDNT
ncbi:hypothetical protein Hanom_Chr11g01057491 [Helianthus anomalus]